MKFNCSLLSSPNLQSKKQNKNGEVVLLKSECQRQQASYYVARRTDYEKRIQLYAAQEVVHYDLIWGG